MSDWQPRIGYRYWFLAREHGADYGNVLSYSDWIERYNKWITSDGPVPVPTFWQDKATKELPLHVKAVVVQEVHLEAQRRVKAARV